MTDFKPNNLNLQDLTNSLELELREQLENTINSLLEKELTIQLDYEKYDRYGWEIDNSRNGGYYRMLDTKYGKIKIKVPRDRKGEYSPLLLSKYQNKTEDLETMIITLYRKGITTREIAKLVEKMYGHHYSPSTISNITDNILEQVNSFHQKTFTKYYPVLYIDCTFINIKRGDIYAKEAVYVALGIDDTGRKEILDYEFNPTESSSMWEEIFVNLKNRGLKSPKLIVSDNLSGINDAILRNFENVQIQTCLVHVMRNISKKVKVIDRKEILQEFTNIRKISNKKLNKKELNQFISRWEYKYPRVINMIKNNPNLFTYLNFPKVIHKSIYSTNLIESVMKIIKTDVKKKANFPNEKSLDKFLFLKVNEYNYNKSIQSQRGFKDLEL